MKRKLISIICILALCMTSVSPAFAAEINSGFSKGKLKGQTVASEVWVNPVYQDRVSEDDLAGLLDQSELKAGKKSGIRTDEYIYDRDEALDAIRAGMINREGIISISYAIALPIDTDAEDALYYVLDDLLYGSLEHTGNPKEGDSLRWVIGGAEYGGSVEQYAYDDEYDAYFFELQFAFPYYTTAAQEAELDAEVERVMTELALDGKSDYDIIKGVYDYICENVVYDTENLKNNPDYDLMYTAYAALIDKKAVCQGYALLFYRFMLEYGIDARLISGYAIEEDGSLGEAHGWNIVELDGKYYFVDSTWDATWLEALGYYGYFLIGSIELSLDHICDDEFTTADFLSEYPVSRANYGHEHIWSDEPIVIPATATSEGYVFTGCTECYEVEEGTEIVTIPKIASIKLSGTSLIYNGKQRAPYPIIKDAEGNELVKGTDYDVTYSSGRTNVGRYKVTVTFKGNYSGTKALYFNILPKAPTTVTAKLYGYDDAQISWSKVTGASGYYVYYKKSTSSKYTLYGRTTGTTSKLPNLADGVYYYFKIVPYFKSGDTRYQSSSYKTAGLYTLKKLTAPAVTKSGTRVKVKWTNINGESGYQISRSTSKTGTNIVATYATTKGTYKYVAATKNKTYYYKVRAYKTVNGKKIYGPWSNVKAYKRK